MSKTKRIPVHGWIAIDKSYGIGSTQALAKCRYLFNAEKAGHGGTLDPLATGVLPIAFGEATKTVNFAMDGSKTYQFTVKWGAETTTDDLEGEVTAQANKLETSDINDLPRNIKIAAVQHEIERVLPQFIGAVQQQPPAYSAIKIDGERAYDLARAGEMVEIAAREVQIDSVKTIGWPTTSADIETTFEVTCGKGTYVRSLARDIGRATGWLGHVTMLRRTKVGPFNIEDAISLEKLEEMSHSPASENSLSGLIRPIETVLDGIPALAVMEAEARRLQQGQRVPIPSGVLPESEMLSEAEAVLVTLEGKPIGIFRIEHRVLKAIRLFNLDARS